MGFVFDGPNKLITIEYSAPVTSITAQDMYSRWKDWVAVGNAQYQPAFGESAGGFPTGAGKFLSGYYFLRNDLGWRFTPEDDHTFEIQIQGDFYPANPDTVADPWFEPSTNGDVLVTFDRSAATFVVMGQGADAAGVAAAVWEAQLADHKTQGSTGKRLGDVKPTAWGL